MTQETVSYTSPEEKKENIFERLRISKREKDVLELKAHGHTREKIGEQLDISPKTVDTYITLITTKANHAFPSIESSPGLRARSTLVQLIRQGILERVLTYDLSEYTQIIPLTPAEEQVLMYRTEGHSNKR